LVFPLRLTRYVPTSVQHTGLVARTRALLLGRLLWALLLLLMRWAAPLGLPLTSSFD
jgi:hypothetical protein